MTDGWVIMNANMDRYRAWQDGGTVWVKDLADATFYARRVDAEAVHLDDVAAWRVVLKPLPDDGEAVHTGQLRDEPVSSSGSGRDEAALPEAVAWRCFDLILGDESVITDSRHAQARAARPEDWRVEPLYAAPPPPPVGGQVGDVETLVKATRAVLELYADDEGCASLPQVVEAHQALAPFASPAPTDREGER